jgi:carbamate kinase
MCRAGPVTPVAVVAIGGNALTAQGQAGSWDEIEANARTVAATVADLAHEGWRVAVVHGNGPQVGNLAIQQEAGRAQVPAQPLHQLCAMTQGQLGSVLVRALDEWLAPGTAVGVVTHVVVDPHDTAFRLPTKPIGPFLTEDEAASLSARLGWTVAQDAGRGFRRIVASPAPADIVEMAPVRALLEAGHVVVAAGGGGIAVTRGPSGVRGVDAVIDKDSAAARLASSIGASHLLLVTAVDAVQLDFGTPQQRPAHRLTVEEAERHLAAGQFPAGSMGPKVAAALQFVRDGGQSAVISSPAGLAAAAQGQPGVGTRIEAAGAAVGSV